MFRSFGRDSDDGGAWLMGAIIALVVICAIVMLFIYVGMFIGGGKAIWNYGKAFKNNVINQAPVSA